MIILNKTKNVLADDGKYIHWGNRVFISRKVDRIMIRLPKEADENIGDTSKVIMSHFIPTVLSSPSSTEQFQEPTDSLISTNPFS